MTIANRILLGFAAMSVLLIVLGIYAITQIGVVRDTTDTIVTRDLTTLRQMAAIRDGQARMRAASEGVVKNFYARNANAGNQQQAVNTFRSEGAQLVTAMTAAISAANEYRTTAVSEDRAGAWTAIATSLTQASMVLEQIRRDVEDQLRAVTANDTATVSMLDQQADVERDQFLQFMQSAEQTLNGAIVAGQARVTEVYNASIVSIIVGLGVAVVLAIVITYGIRRSIVVPLTAFMEFVERVGRGDLAGRTANVSADEIGRLGGTLNTMVDGLRQLAKQTRDATENLNAATAEIRASTQEQAAGVEEQLAAVQETAATVDEITHAGTQIGKRAQEVIATAQATANTSTQGLRAVDDTSRAMDAIREQAEAVAENIVSLSEKTQAIGDIITTVNDISERSHLLALNAAIEAAAAGENGRSFAVVASEMKLLADQAKEATGQVRAILGDIQRGINSSVMLTEEAVKRVAAGKERTDTTQRTITEMTARVQEGVQTFQQIVASTNQQQLGIEQVMGALQNIRQASQQTAAGTRQLDAAAANLAGLSQQLLTLAERYRY